jgi:hypothetical protein
MGSKIVSLQPNICSLSFILHCKPLTLAFVLSLCSPKSYSHLATKIRIRMTALLHRTSSDLASMSRAAQRKQRLLEIEKEQHLEDAEALKMTEVCTLHCPVKLCLTRSAGTTANPPTPFHLGQSGVQRSRRPQMDALCSQKAHGMLIVPSITTDMNVPLIAATSSPTSRRPLPAKFPDLSFIARPTHLCHPHQHRPRLIWH